MGIYGEGSTVRSPTGRQSEARERSKIYLRTWYCRMYKSMGVVRWAGGINVRQGKLEKVFEERRTNTVKPLYNSSADLSLIHI